MIRFQYIACRMSYVANLFKFFQEICDHSTNMIQFIKQHNFLYLLVYTPVPSLL